MSEESTSHVCPSCGTQGSLTFTIYSRHFHVFWIPFIPLGRKGVYQCSHCKLAKYIYEMEPEAKQVFEDQKTRTRIPLWQFSGLILLAFLIAWFYLAVKEDNASELTFVQNPKIGDVYTFRDDANDYSTLKLIYVTSDSVEFVYNQYSIDRYVDIKDIDVPENYDEESYIIARSDLEDLYHEKEFMNIERKN